MDLSLLPGYFSNQPYLTMEHPTFLYFSNECTQNFLLSYKHGDREVSGPEET